MKTEYIERANRIATDNVSSAQQILRDTLDLLLDFCMKHSGEEGFVSELKSISATLSNAQAQMAALSNLVRLVESAAGRLPGAEICTYVNVLRQKVGAASTRAAEEASGLIVPGRSYATLSQSEFVGKAFQKAASDGRTATVYVMESRPLFEGRQTARALKAMGHRSILVSDASVGFFIDSVDAAFVGADAVLADGTLVNKIGSYALAAACSIAGKKFYAVTSVLKFDPSKTAADFRNKEESPHEIYPNPEFEVRNIYFDTIPPGLVTLIATEAGIFTPVSTLSQGTFGAGLEAATREIYG